MKKYIMVKVVKSVPYQKCPLCNGLGMINVIPDDNSVRKQCSVCEGEKIIPMYCIEPKKKNLAELF